MFHPDNDNKENMKRTRQTARMRPLESSTKAENKHGRAQMYLMSMCISMPCNAMAISFHSFFAGTGREEAEEGGAEMPFRRWRKKRGGGVKSTRRQWKYEDGVKVRVTSRATTVRIENEWAAGAR